LPRPFGGFRLWLLGLVVTIIGSTIAFSWIDVPVARHFAFNADRFGVIDVGLSGIVLLIFETAVVTSLLVRRMIRGKLEPLGKALVISGIASMCAYLLNEAIFKFLFGIPSPNEMLFQGAPHAVHFFSGNAADGFPSGHMMLSGAFAGALMRFYPRLRKGLFALLGVGALILVWGDWHFVSDVIAGTFLGITIGLLIAAPRTVRLASDLVGRNGLFRRKLA
jgi:membrane-associated phospholipid phosphatase